MTTTLSLIHIFRSHCGRRDLFWQNTDEVAAVLCGNEGFAFALCKAGLHQLFNDTGAGRGSAETFLLGVIVELIVSGSLHCRQEGIFRVLLRRCREVFGDAGRYTHYIMFLAGLEMDMDDFKKNRTKGLVFGMFTFLIPMGLGIWSSMSMLNLSLIHI